MTREGRIGLNGEPGVQLGSMGLQQCAVSDPYTAPALRDPLIIERWASLSSATALGGLLGPRPCGTILLVGDSVLLPGACDGNDDPTLADNPQK